MSEQPYSTDSNQQRARILAHLQLSPLTTLQARQELDILHPAARIQELREAGHNIITHWATSDTGKAKHRVACYVLLVESIC
ncbi:helix-turn-helix domain-containing protein [Methylobacter sp.]|uniref:helix-turn-helix domain-containing protein n=1 Tax=Methylobacter sp. TaxID=2051955 RepID=UPI00248A82CA|nr:helix-turn-helix domain-containing protein [Methylobacter sp.]MDI1278515.1 helix-turn-helix domain-containing protein [Methylobacter sp.]MDI1359289.1 helix-turn-helix domain-containing protein [Methylobacter sp.]